MFYIFKNRSLGRTRDFYKGIFHALLHKDKVLVPGLTNPDRMLEEMKNRGINVEAQNVYKTPNLRIIHTHYGEVVPSEQEDKIQTGILFKIIYNQNEL